METNIKFLNLVAVATLTLGIFACKKNVPPAVTIDNSIYATQTTANVTGNVTDEGGTPVTDRGFIYGKQGGSKQDTAYCGSGGGDFPTRLTRLEPNTTYNCMAFATNSAGTSVSSKASFTTLPMAMAEITTSEATVIGSTTATCGGNVSNDGGSEVIERGVCYGTSQNPTTSNSYISSGNGIGNFTVNFIGLTPNTTYYARAYATNSKGTAYGNNVTFKTSQPVYLISEGGMVMVSSTVYFFDSGGDNGNYSNAENYIMTFKPATSGKIRADFASFLTGSVNDALTIYNGETTSSSARIGTYYQSYVPGIVTSTSSDGALTFKWHSENLSTTKYGWKAIITVVQ